MATRHTAINNPDVEETNTKPPNSPSDGISYFFQQENWVFNAIIGGLLLIFSFTLFPLFVIVGYLWKTSNHIQNNNPPPRFTGWYRLFLTGIKGIAIPFVLPLITIVPFAAIGVIALLASGSLTEEISQTAESTILGLTLLGYIAYIYLLPAGFVIASRRNRLRDLFSRKPFKIAIRPGYFIVWLLAGSASIGLLITTLIFAFIPILGTFVSAVTMFVTLVTTTAMFSTTSANYL